MTTSTKKDTARAIDITNLVHLTKDLHPADICTALNKLPLEKALLILMQLPPKDLVVVFSHFKEKQQDKFITIMPITSMIRLIEHMPSDDRVDLYNRLSSDIQQVLLPALAKIERDDIKNLASFSEDSIGSVTSTDYIYVTQEMTVLDAFNHIRQTAQKKETIYVLYVLNENFKLLGTISLRDLVLANDHVTMESIMRRNPVFAQAEWPREHAAELIRHYDLLALPITTYDDKMLGIVTVDDAMDIDKEQDTAQLARFGGTASLGDTDLNIRSSSLKRMFHVRLFWLVILTIFGVITSMFVAAQEEILSEVIILAAFLAPIVDMGGNTGSQSATLVIRAMALGQVKLQWRDIGFVITRELPIALALGVVIGVLEAILAYFSKGIEIEVLLTIGCSMLVVTALGGIIGGLLPFAARRLGTDPATLSSPMITSIMDLIGVFIYFGFAYMFLADLLP